MFDEEYKEYTQQKLRTNLSTRFRELRDSNAYSITHYIHENKHVSNMEGFVFISLILAAIFVIDADLWQKLLFMASSILVIVAYINFSKFIKELCDHIFYLYRYEILIRKEVDFDRRHKIHDLSQELQDTVHGLNRHLAQMQESTLSKNNVPQESLEAITYYCKNLETTCQSVKDLLKYDDFEKNLLEDSSFLKTLDELQ